MHGVIIQIQILVFFNHWIKKMFSKGKGIPKTLFEARKVTAKYTQSKMDTLYIQFIHLWKLKQSVLIVYFGIIKKKISKWRSYAPD